MDSSKKDVLFLCQFFYPEVVSSATLPTELAEDIVASDLAVGVLCGCPKRLINKNKQIGLKENYNGISICRVKYSDEKGKGKLGRIISFFSLTTSLALRFNFILKHKCVMVFSNPPILPIIPALLTRISNIKFIFVLYDIYPDVAYLFNTFSPNSFLAKIMNFTNRIVYKNVSKVVVLNEDMRDYIVKKKYCKEEKVEVIHNWYDKNKVNINPTSALNTYYYLKENNSFVILYSGNMGTCQDMQTIMDAIMILKDHEGIKFVFTGHGNKVEELKAFVENNKLKNVQILGFLLGNEYEDMLKIADCCMLSLEPKVEKVGSPSKLYGYLAAGKPVIAVMTPETELASVLEGNKAGIVIKQGDAPRLAYIFKKLSEDNSDCKIMGENARKLFETHYERKISTSKYINIIKNILK